MVTEVYLRILRDGDETRRDKADKGSSGVGGRQAGAHRSEWHKEEDDTEGEKKTTTSEGSSENDAIAQREVGLDWAGQGRTG